MADGKGLYVILCFVFLLSECSLKTFGEEKDDIKDDIKEVENSEAATTGQKERGNGIAPGEVVLSNLDSKTKDGETTLDGEKKDIKQSEDGKTTEEVKTQEEIKKSEEEGEKKGEIEANEQTESKEEPGIDLKILKDNDFEHLTQASSGATTGDWLVLFSKKDCENCTEAEKELKIVYERLNHKLNVAKVEQSSSSKLTFKRFNIEDFPTILLFHHGKKYSFQGNKTVDEFINFVDEKYQLMPWGVVREPYTSFELFVEESYDELQHMLRYKKNVALIIFLTGFAVGISLTTICGSVLFHLLENFKDEDEEEKQEPELRKNKAE